MATAQQMADYEANRRTMTFETVSAAASTVLAAYDLHERDREFLRSLMAAGDGYRWINLMQRDRRGRLLHLVGTGEEPALRYQACDWPDGFPSTGRDAQRRTPADERR